MKYKGENMLREEIYFLFMRVIDENRGVSEKKDLNWRLEIKKSIGIFVMF